MNTTTTLEKTKMEYHVPAISYDIDDVLFEMEERSLLPEANNNDFNIVDELRCYLGEEKFMEFLKRTNRLWQFELDSLKEEDDD